MIDLKPCPFCGSPAKPGVMPVDDGGHFVACTNRACGASTNLRFACGDDPAPLQAEQWNRRVDSADNVADALAGLIGWAQMLLAQPALPPGLRERFANNHRLTTAVIENAKRTNGGKEGGGNGR